MNKQSIFGFFGDTPIQREALNFAKGFVNGWQARCEAAKGGFLPCIGNIEPDHFKALCDVLGTPGAPMVEFTEGTFFSADYLPF